MYIPQNARLKVIHRNGLITLWKKSEEALTTCPLLKWLLFDRYYAGTFTFTFNVQ